jgi:hypothetical protein
MTDSPSIPEKSPTLRVANANPQVRATDAICASSTLIGLPAPIRAATTPAYLEAADGQVLSAFPDVAVNLALGPVS